MHDKQVAAVIILELCAKKQETLKEVKIKRKRRVWTKPWLKDRVQQSAYTVTFFKSYA